MLTSHHLASARFADKPEDFAKLGILPRRIQPFEDGMRTKADRAVTSGGTSIPTWKTARRW
jgi:hypothetical protein